ncbi:protein disulfide-isomerase A5-like [Argiope bruennichi]|uniref:protein disulfide-isomerase A5-like n=1 Tax=Argiope bruennichi TaxID=94029 RepID=UPI002493E8A4|nr:protein disulfide-isomerase A5-like [Argiope bruennichi]
MACIRKSSFGFLLLLLVLFLLQTLITCKKTSSVSLVENIVDYKELKRLCKTRTNVLILYTQGMDQNVELINVFNKVAEVIKGQASLALIDCAGGGKKLCRKLKISPETFFLKHYKDGQFHKDYDRQLTVQSMVNFLKDPTGDRPWEEEESAKDIFHVPDPDVLGRLLSKENVPIMMMFYAPWCGFCKRIKPEYAAVATELKNKAIMAAMDLHKPENAAVRQHFNITGFPTLLYFENGRIKHKYDGENSREGLLNFMRNPGKQPEKPKEEEWSDTPSEVYHLTDENFSTTIESEPSVLVMFYAPWCGHCKKMKPEFESAAQQMKEQDIPGVLAAVDAIKAKTIADRFKITGYPTLKYFKRGEFQFDVNFRTADKIVEFMNDPKEPPPPPPPEVPWSEEPSHVVHLKEDDFKPFLKRKKHVLVMFYAPWCGHCKKAKPEFTAAAEFFKDEPKVEFAAVDCTSFSSICSAHNVKGYPTLKYFNYYKVDKLYEGSRSEKDFIDYMLAAVDSIPPLNSESPEDPETFWSEVPNGHLVNYLKDSTFHQIMQSKKSALVMFYAPWSGHCKALRRVLAEVAAKVKEQKIDCFIAAVDGTVETSLQAEFSIRAYTTLKYFKNGKVQFDVEDRTVDKLLEFVKDPKEPPPREIPWSDEPSNVVHLKEEDFKPTLKSTRHVLVMFYAPWCGHCKRAKPEYTAAAAYFKDDPEVKLAAVDCTVHNSLCTAYDVNSYPTFIYFNFYNVEKPYDGSRTKHDFIKYMEAAIESLNPKTATPPAHPDKFWSEVAHGERVHYLKDSTFHEVLKSKPSALVMFYSHWNAESRELRYIFAEAAAKMNEKKINGFLAAVDVTVETSLQIEYAIRSAPTVHYFRYGELIKEYAAPLTVDDIVQYMKNRLVKEEL